MAWRASLWMPRALAPKPGRLWSRLARGARLDPTNKPSFQSAVRRSGQQQVAVARLVFGLVTVASGPGCNDSGSDDTASPTGDASVPDTTGMDATDDEEPFVAEYRCQGPVLQVSIGPDQWVTDQLCASEACCQPDPPACRLPRFGCPDPTTADAGQ